ncbi:nitrilase-related carbon-nitrogen hydrolase [Roseiconus lacunae]|uniref:nitrilase-related carbon-nitrogen hydrolase n=1 Tax=Roseiconus lacunae TaxID=2605694 RepID=UPI0011F21B2F|nr:nitrilase-related carbon-nitrogen hydrolase [Roseiconus lacunae]
MQVVAIQLDMVWEDRAANHQRVEQLIDATAIAPGSLVMLPEMFETGFSMNPERTKQSEDREGEALLRRLAAKYDVAMMGGVVNEYSAGDVANECVAFAPDGRELVRYRKMRPFSLSGEADHYGAGTQYRLFEWQGVKIAPFVCYDLRFPELFRAAVKDGAELITLIACWPAKRSEHWVRLMQARAIENLAYVVGVNRCGEEPSLKFDGRSSAFDHLGNCLFEASDQVQALKTELDFGELRRWREKFPALRDLKANADL